MRSHSHNPTERRQEHPSSVILSEMTLEEIEVSGGLKIQMNDIRYYPTDMLCPITRQPFCNPVFASDGHVYEREAIKQWLNAHTTSPCTGVEVTEFYSYKHEWIPESTCLKPLVAMKGAVEEFTRNHLVKLKNYNRLRTRNARLQRELNQQPTVHNNQLLAQAEELHTLRNQVAQQEEELAPFRQAVQEAIAKQRREINPQPDLVLTSSNEPTHQEREDSEVIHEAVIVEEQELLDDQLFSAVQDGNVADVQQLLTMGANLEARREGITPLIAAVANLQTPVVEHLLNHEPAANVNVRMTDPHYQTQESLTQGIQPNEFRIQYQATPLIIAVCAASHLQNSQEGLRMVRLLCAHGANLEALDCLNKSARFWALEIDHEIWRDLAARNNFFNPGVSAHGLFQRRDTVTTEQSQVPVLSQPQQPQLQPVSQTEESGSNGGRALHFENGQRISLERPRLLRVPENLRGPR